VLAAEQRAEAQDLQYTTQQEAAVKARIAELEARRKELLGQLGFPPTLAKPAAELPSRGPAGVALERVLGELTLAGKRRDELLLQRKFPEYEAGRRWKSRSRDEEGGGLTAVREVLLERLEGEIEVRMGALGAPAEPGAEATHFPDAPAGSAFLDVQLSDVRVKVLVEDLKMAGSFLSSLFSPSKLDLVIDMPAIRVPAYYCPCK
jgi:hypothetical protein